MEKPIYELEECPICRGAGLIMHEGGWNVQVECTDCSAHTVYVEYSNEEEKKEAEEMDSYVKSLGDNADGADDNTVQQSRQDDSASE